MNSSNLIRIGVLARKANEPISTIHFYLREGLLDPAGRTDSGYMLFDPESALSRLRRIRDLQRRERLRLSEIHERLSKEENA